LASVFAPTAETERMLREAMNLTLAHIKQTYEAGLEESGLSDGEVPPSDRVVGVHLEIANSDAKMKIGTDESYSLRISSTVCTQPLNLRFIFIMTECLEDYGVSSSQDGIVAVIVQGNTFFGVRHGLETLTQLIAFNEFSSLLEVRSCHQRRLKLEAYYHPEL